MNKFIFVHYVFLAVLCDDFEDCRGSRFLAINKPKAQLELRTARGTRVKRPKEVPLGCESVSEKQYISDQIRHTILLLFDKHCLESKSIINNALFLDMPFTF